MEVDPHVEVGIVVVDRRARQEVASRSLEPDDEVGVLLLRCVERELVIPPVHQLPDDLRNAVPALGTITFDLPGPLELLLRIEPDPDVESTVELGREQREEAADDHDLAGRDRLGRPERAGRVVVGGFGDRLASPQAADVVGHQVEVVGPGIECRDPLPLACGSVQLVVIVEADVGDPLGPEDPVEPGDERRLSGATVAADGDQDRSFGGHVGPGASEAGRRPQVERDPQLRRCVRGRFERLAGRDRLDRGSCCGGSGPAAPGMPVDPTAEQEEGVLAERRVELRHVARVQPSGGDRHDRLRSTPGLIEQRAPARQGEILGQHPASLAHLGDRALELAHAGPHVDMVDAEEPRPLGDSQEIDPVVGLAVEDGVHGPVGVECQAQALGLLAERRRRGKTGREEVDHDEPATLQGDLVGAADHLAGVGCRHIRPVPLALAGLGLGAPKELERPSHSLVERRPGLAIEVLIVLDRVDPTPQRLVRPLSMLARRQAELGLDRGAGQRPAVDRELVSNAGDPKGGSRKGLHQRDGEAHVEEPEVRDGLEAEHIADHAGQDVGDAPELEQLGRIGDVGDLAVDPVDPCPQLERQPFVGLVDVGPGARRGLRRDRRGRLIERDVGARREAECDQQVGRGRHVVEVEVQLPVWVDTLDAVCENPCHRDELPPRRAEACVPGRGDQFSRALSCCPIHVY